MSPAPGHVTIHPHLLSPIQTRAVVLAFGLQHPATSPSTLTSHLPSKREQTTSSSTTTTSSASTTANAQPYYMPPPHPSPTHRLGYSAEPGVSIHARRVPFRPIHHPGSSPEPGSFVLAHRVPCRCLHHPPTHDLSVESPLGCGHVRKVVCHRPPPLYLFLLYYILNVFLVCT